MTSRPSLSHAKYPIEFMASLRKVSILQICFDLLVYILSRFSPTFIYVSIFIRKRQSGLHYQMHRRRRHLEELYNRLNFVYHLTEQATPRFVALRLEVNDSPNLGVSAAVTHANSTGTGRRGSRRPGTFFTSGSESEVIRRRQQQEHLNGGENEEEEEAQDGVLVSYKVPIGDGLRIRVETEQPLNLVSEPRLSSHQRMPEFALRRKISDLCRKIKARVSSGVVFSCFGAWKEKLSFRDSVRLRSCQSLKALKLARMVR